MKRALALFALALALALFVSCASIPPDATHQNLEEWEAVSNALEEGRLTTGDPDLDLTWQARARAAKDLAKAMHRANTGEDDE